MDYFLLIGRDRELFNNDFLRNTENSLNSNRVLLRVIYLIKVIMRHNFIITLTKEFVVGLILPKKL